MPCARHQGVVGVKCAQCIAADSRADPSGGLLGELARYPERAGRVSHFYSREEIAAERTRLGLPPVAHINAPSQGPIQHRPIEPRPSEQRPIEQRPIAQRPIEQRRLIEQRRPIEQRPIAQRPIEQRPIEQLPIAQRSGEQKTQHSSSRSSRNNNNVGTQGRTLFKRALSADDEDGDSRSDSD